MGVVGYIVKSDGVRRLSPALDVGKVSRGLDYVTGVLLLPVRCCNSVRHEPRDHRQVIPGRLRRLPTGPRQIKRLTSHRSAAGSSQTVTGNRTTCVTSDGAKAEVMIWNSCQ